MSNFDFVKATLPTVHDDCRRAESYLAGDPRSACFYSRRAIEMLVAHLYDVLALAQPYRNDLNARINAPKFKTVTGGGISTKLNLIRTLGNKAVHEQKPIPPHAALTALRELHHLMVWAAFHHSARPQGAPTQAQFDPALAVKAAPLTRDEVVRLAAKFRAKDEAHAKALAEKDELAAAKDAEISTLREQIKAAQAARTTIDDHDYSEAETRDRFIDVLLGEAGWPLSEDRDREYPVTGMPNGGKGVVDYVLWGADGLPLALVEAKRTTKSAQVGQQQAKLYADCLERRFGRRPLIFYTNGYQHWLWDDDAGYPPREVAGFYTRDELELTIQRRQTRQQLSSAAVNTVVAGRPYQIRAIKAVGGAFDSMQREALLVMATGSGKTRTIIALVDQLMKAGWAKRVLFLADRTALVNQAVGVFKTQLPSATTVNLMTEKLVDGRVYVSTYPTMLNLINDTDAGLRKFGPGYFDLVVIDEAHRSVYQKYGAIFEWFDSLLIGLTATPKNEVDRNTYRLFHLEDGIPTDAYSLDEAVADGWLVPPRGVAVGTKFLRSGIRYVDLTEEEKDQWDSLDWGDGDVPDKVGAEELNQFLFNEDTADKVLATLMTHGYKVAGGDRLGKTIVFAKNRAHAEFVQARFDAQYPHLAGQFARVITHGTPYVQSLIDDFSIAEKAPHVAISVDMLDTGIDVPEVVNLVFFKTVQSKSKFWQMIGRGTRLRPDLFGPNQEKKNFLVFDFCGNLEFFGQDLPGSDGSLQKSLSQRLFEARLGLVLGLNATGSDHELGEANAHVLHAVVAGMSLDNVIVRPQRQWVERYSDSSAWSTISAEDAEEVRIHLAGLPSSVQDDDEDAKRFDLLVLRRQLAQLEGDIVAGERLRSRIQDIAAALLGKRSIPSVAQHSELLGDIAGDQWWVDVTLPMLELARLRIRGLVRLVEAAKRLPVYTDFEDVLNEATDVDLPGVTPGTNLGRFRAKVTAYLRQHDDNLALQRLRRNKQLTPEDLTSLEEMLRVSGAGQQNDIDRAAEAANGLGLFIRSLVGLDRQAANEAFARYFDADSFSVDQIRFVNLIINELTANGVMEPSRLYEPPYTDHAPTGPEGVFVAAEIDVIVAILHKVAEHARPGGAA